MAEFDEQLKSLRDELLVAQTQRLELAKFKLVAIAVLGSVAIGANGIENGRGAAFVIALAPIVGLYIDSLADSKKVQFSAIAAFLRNKSRSTLLGEYEAFCEENREVFYQNYAYRYSTALVSIAISIMGFLHILTSSDLTLLGVTELVSGLLGVIGAVLLSRSTRNKLYKLSALQS